MKLCRERVSVSPLRYTGEEGGGGGGGGKEKKEKGKGGREGGTENKDKRENRKEIKFPMTLYRHTDRHTYRQTDTTITHLLWLLISLSLI